MNFYRRAAFICLVTIVASALVAPPHALAAASFSQNLQLWDTGLDARLLQKVLNAQGFIVAENGAGSPGQETETFGNHTYQALISFQSAHDLPATGFFGPLTRALANSTFSTSPSAAASGSPSSSTTSLPVTSSQATATTSQQYIPGVTPLPGYAPGQIIFAGGGPDPVCSISVSSGSISNGQSSTLTWSSSYASSATISALGGVALSGSQSVSPTSDTTYALSVSGNGGSGTCSASIDVAPVISSVASTTITGESATITWTTNKNADTQLAYGSTSAYGATTTLDSTLVTSHSVVINGLTESTVYHFRIRSADSSGNVTYSGDYSFTTAPPLASLPLATGAKVSAIGDSIIGYNNYAGGTGNTDLGAYSYAYGAVEEALAADPRFNFDSWYDPGDIWDRNISGADNGVFGDHLVGSGVDPTPGILNRLPTVLSHNPDIVIFEGGTNTINSSDDGTSNTQSAAYVESEINTALTEIREAGKYAILETILPRGDWPAGDPRYQTVLDVNTWIRSQAGREGILGIWDSWDVLAPGGVQDPTLFQVDMVHQNSKGAYLMATQGASPLLSILDANISSGSTFNQDPTVSNLFGASIGNMTGTTGTKIGGGGGTTGSVATGFSLRMTRGGSSQVASKETISGSLTRQVVTITPVLDATNLGWHDTTLTSPQATTSLPAAGTWIQAYIFVEIGNTPSIGYSKLTLQIRNSTTVVAQQIAMDAFSADFLMPTVQNRSFWIITKPMQVPNATFTNLIWTLETGFSDTATDTPVIKYSRPIIRTIPDPRTAWGF